MQLRPYQEQVITDIYQAWKDGAQNVVAQLATGAGKTVIFSHIIAKNTGHAIAIVHRVELVSQISLTLARYGIRHNIVGQKSGTREIVSIHMAELGRSF
jgi:superfamily II DNA or RNA helicase